MNFTANCTISFDIDIDELIKNEGLAIFSTSEEIERGIDDFFAGCDDEIYYNRHKWSKQVFEEVVKQLDKIYSERPCKFCNYFCTIEHPNGKNHTICDAGYLCDLHSTFDYEKENDTSSITYKAIGKEDKGCPDFCCSKRYIKSNANKSTNL